MGTARVGLGLSGCSSNFSAVGYDACVAGKRQTMERVVVLSSMWVIVGVVVTCWLS